MLRVPFSLLIAICCIQFGNAQCPETTIVNFNPDLGSSLCPGESVTIDLTGMNLPQGTIDWYLEPGDDDFNPYEGEGMPIGTSIITPDEEIVETCDPCPTLLAIMIDACNGNGSEQDNEFLIIASGGGIDQASDIQINLSEQNNFEPGGTNVNNDINLGNNPCGFQNFPDLGIIQSLQSTADCGFDNIIGIGPNDPIPAGALVVVFTSSNLNLGYDFNGLCSNGETVYVLQSNCARVSGAFSNSTSSGCRNTVVTIDGCGCQSGINYDTDNASNFSSTGGYVYFDDMNDNGVVDYTFGCNSNEIIHDNGIPCVSPPVESIPVPTIPSVIESFTYTIPLNFCDEFGTDTYSIVGAINPLSEECAGGGLFGGGNTEDFLTDTYTFVTQCKQPDLETPDDLCIGESIVLNDLVDDIDQYGSTGWYDNQDPFSGNEITTFNATEEGDFTYYFFPTGSGGDCYSSGNVTITVTSGTSFTLGTGTVCQSETAYDLTALEDPSFSDGVWTLNGTTVPDNLFDATGLSGDIELTFEPNNPDNSSCLSPQTTTLTVTDGPNLSPTTSNDLGCTDNTATLSSGASGSTLSYEWSGVGIDATNTSDAEPTVSDAGTYNVTVTNTETTCQSIAMVELMQNSTDAPDVDAQVNGMITCSDETIMLDGISDDATSFSWTAPDGVTTFDDENPMVSDTGTYTLTITDLAGCTASTTLFVDADTMPPMIGVLLSNDLNCTNPTANLFGNSPEEDLTDFEWILNNETVSTEQNLMDVTAAGSYMLIVTDMNGCTNSDQVSIAIDTVAPVAVIDEDIDVLTCTQTSVALDATASSVNVGFNWQTPTSSIIGPTPEVDEPGIYTLIVSASNGCTDTASIEVTQLIDPPSIALEADTLDCSGNTVGIQSTSPEMITEYSWSGPDSYFSSNASPDDILISGTYSVTVTASNGCTNDATTVVETDDNVPTAQIDTLLGTVINCTDTNLPFEVTDISPNSTIEWTFPNTITSNEVLINATEEGNYSLMITGDNGCSSTLSVAITEDTNEPTLQVLPTGELNCTNNASFLVNSNTTDIVWTLPDMTTQTGSNFEASTEGTYIVTATAENGCVNSETIEVTANDDPPSIDSIESGDLTCTNNEAELMATSSMSNVIFNWETPNGGETLVGANQTVDVAGEYTLIVTNLNNNCTSTASTTVAPADDAPDALITSDEGTALDCNTENVELIGSSSTMGVSYEWMAPNNTTFSTASIDADQEGTYILTVINNDCTTTESITVSLDNAAPQNVTASSGTIFCNPDSVVLNVSSDDAMASYEWFLMNNSVANADEVTVFNEGTYTVVATGLNGCTSTTTSEVLIDQNPPSIGTEGATLDCSGTEFSIEGNSINMVDYEWTDPNGDFFSNDPNPSVSEIGTYTLTVTDIQTGCTNSESVEVQGATDIPSIVVDNMTPTLDCNTTSVELTASSDASNATFEWVDDMEMVVSNDAVFDNATLGSYTVQVTTDSGCSNAQSIEVQDASVQPEVQIDTTTTVLDCENQSIVLMANSNVTSPSYEWQNDNGDVLSTDNAFTATEEGNITLFVFDGNCSNSTTQLITSNGSLPNIDITVTSDENIIDCDTDNVELTGVSMNNVSYSWSGPNDFEATTPVIQADIAGDYVLTITDLDNGCTNMSTTTVFDDFAQPAVSADGGVIDCVSNGTTLSATTPIPNSTFEWTLNEVFVSDEATPFVSQQGTYTLIVTSPTNGCTDTTTALVTLDTDFPVLEAETEPITCVNTVTFLDASASSPINNDVTYQWFLNNVPVGTNDIMPSVTEAGMYQLIGTNTTNQCADTLLLEVTENTIDPTADAGDNTEINCTTNTTILNGTASMGQGDLSYQWLTFSGNEISQDSVVEVDTGMPYTLIVTDIENGCTDTAEVEVIDNTLEPQAAIVSTGMIDCNQSTVELDATGSLGSTDLVYQWLNENQVELGTSPTQTVDAGGIYTLVLTNNENGCTDSMPITITADTLTPNIVFATPDMLNCNNEEVILDALSSDSGTNIEIIWTPPVGATISDMNSLNPTVTQAGTYTLMLQNNNNGCESTQSLTVEEDIETPDAVANTSDELGCDVTMVQLLGAGSSEGMMFSYEWSGTSIVSQNDILNAETDAAGIYTLVVTNTINGCTEMATTEVLQNEDGIETGIVDVENESCFGDANGTIAITEVVGGAAPYMYGINGENLVANPNFSNLSPGTYPILVEDIDGCQWTASFDVEAANPITVELGENIITQAGQIINLDVFTNAVVDTIIWSDTTLEGESPSFVPVTSTTINVTVVDENGCTETDAINIFIEQGSSVYIPNAFSPNADSVNDVFKIYGDEAVQIILDFQVFDRWGTLVYQAQDFQLDDEQNGWDGFFRNKILDPAVFVYFAEIELTNGQTEIYKGDVTLMR